MAAQPREMVVGNIVRRVLGLIRDEAEDDRDAEFALSEAGSESQPHTPRAFDGWFPVAQNDHSKYGDSHRSNRCITALGPRRNATNRRTRAVFFTGPPSSNFYVQPSFTSRTRTLAAEHTGHSIPKWPHAWPRTYKGRAGRGT